MIKNIIEENHPVSISFFKVKGNKVKSVSYKSSNKAVKVTKKGKVTVAKNAKRGTYKVTVTVAGNKNYNKAVKTIKVTVK